MSEIQLRGVTKRYHDLEVISGLDLTIDDGAFTVMVGPSGCGKSTLLRMVAGLEPITGGDLLIDGQRSNDLDPVQRGVAMVFQNYALYPHMTVARNIGFSLKMAGLPRAEVERRVNEAADTLKIAHLLGRKPAELSGGQRQRVAIGRAIVRDPNVFLFDEPLSNLDAELRVTMRVELARLHRRLRSTMLYVTHDQVEAMTLADKIVVMREGRIEQIGAPHQLYTDPDNVFVAGFIGSPRMNFLEANAYDGTLRLGDGAAFAVSAGVVAGPCTVGLRPEHLSIGGAGEHTLGVSVDMIEYLGGTRYVYGRLADETPVTIEVREDGGAVQPGDRVQATFQGAQIMLFGPDGRRIRSGIPILN